MNINYLLNTGDAPSYSKQLRLKMKKIWFEHVKRRPEINYVMQPEREAIWERQKKLIGNQFLQKPPGFEPTYTKEEQTIIDTPIDQLMRNYEKDLITQS